MLNSLAFQKSKLNDSIALVHVVRFCSWYYTAVVVAENWVDKLGQVIVAQLADRRAPTFEVLDERFTRATEWVRSNHI